MSEQTRGITDADFGDFYRAQTREWRARALYNATSTLSSIVASDALDLLSERDSLAARVRELEDELEAVDGSLCARLDVATEACTLGAKALWALNDWLADQPVFLPVEIVEQAGNALVKLQRAALTPEEPKS